MPAPAITLNCHLQDIFGNVNQGSIIFILLNLADRTIPRVASTGVLATQFEVTSDANGFITTPIYGNDVIVPGPNQTAYCLMFKDAAGGVVSSGLYQFIGSGVQDLSNILPLSAVPVAPIPAPPTAVLINPTGQQAIIGFPLLGAFAGLSVVAFSATPTFDATNQGAFVITLAGNVTSSSLVNASPGQFLVFHIVQDATGSRQFAWPANIHNAQTVDPTLSTRSIQVFQMGEAGIAYPVATMTVNT